MTKVDPDALLAQHAKHNGPLCKIVGLTGVPRRVFDRGMERDPKEVSATTIVRALRSLGVVIDATTVRRHRNGDCLTCQIK